MKSFEIYYNKTDKTFSDEPSYDSVMIVVSSPVQTYVVLTASEGVVKQTTFTEFKEALHFQIENCTKVDAVELIPFRAIQGSSRP